MGNQSDHEELPPSPLQSVDRALFVLQSLGEGRRSWGVTELAGELQVDTSTAQRVLAALAARRFLHRDPVTRRYTLGGAMWAIASSWEGGGGLRAWAAPVVRRLAAATKRTALLCVPDGAYIRCIAAAHGAEPLRPHTMTGELYPANAGATSRAYFAFLEPDECERLLAGAFFAPYTPLTVTDRALMDAQFEECRRLGYATSEGEYDPAARALAIPVWVNGRPIASLSLDEVKGKYQDPLLDHLPVLQQAAAELASQMSGTVGAPKRRRQPG